MSEWIKDSFVFYKRHWLGLLSIVLPLAVLQEFIFIQWGYYELLTTTEFQFDGLLSFIAVSMFIGFFLQLFVIFYIESTLNQKVAGFGSLMTRALAVMPYFIVLNILVSIAAAMGFLLFIIPGVYIFIKLILSPYFFLLAGKKMFASMQHSWQATRGYGWDLFMGVIIVIVISSIPSWFISETPSLINSLLNIISTCLSIVMVIFLYRAYDFVTENPRYIE